MKGILIRIKPGHQMDGEGESLGTALDGNSYTFWRSAGEMEVPVELAIKLEKESPKRFEIIDRKLARTLIKDTQGKGKQPVKPSIQINEILDQVEKILNLSKKDQLDLMKKLGIVPDKKGKEFDRTRKIILSGHKL